MSKWTDYFDIRILSFYDWRIADKFQLVTIHDGKVVGTYADYKYAKKQAKYKFKKLQSKLEKILLSQ